MTRPPTAPKDAKGVARMYRDRASRCASVGTRGWMSRSYPAGIRLCHR